MARQILILGASGTVGSAVFKVLSQDNGLRVAGTCFSKAAIPSSGLLRFSLKEPGGIRPLLDRVRPDLIISCLRGSFPHHLSAHEAAADYLAGRGGKLIYLSSANVFDGDLERPHFESDLPCPVSPYGTFKAQCEELLRRRLGSRAVLIRLPFVWGPASPRLLDLKAGCSAGRLTVYEGLFSNHASDLQIARFIHWVIQTDGEGVFHTGTPEAVSYLSFACQLIDALDMKRPEWIVQKEPGIRAVLSGRRNIPQALQWNTSQLIQYLSGQ